MEGSRGEALSDHVLVEWKCALRAAVSVLAVSAPVVMLSIALGARLGLAYLLEGSVWGALGRWRGGPAE